MGNTPKTLQAAIQYFADPDRCIDFLRDQRWPDGKVRCPNCGREDVSYVAARRVWQCKSRHAKSQFSIKVGTIFEDSPIGLSSWLMAMWMVANCKNGVSSWEIHRTLGVTQKTAWFMLHRIRLALGVETSRKLEGGPIEVDETYVGGKPGNMHSGKRKMLLEKYGKNTPKPAVMGMLDRETRQVRAKVLGKIERGTLMSEVLNGIKKGSTVYTDQHAGYSAAERYFIHETVNHMLEYVRGQVHTQGIENFWSLLKRGLHGTYVSVEPFHLDRYVTEQVFRYNNRATKDNPLTDGDRFALAVSQIVGKRLTYAELTGRVSETSEPF
jgi:transposase-like protein